MIMRAALVISCLGFQGAALVAQAQGINEDPRRRRAVLPSIRAATDCIAREALSEPNISSAAEQKQLRTILAQPMRRCADELDAMVAMHDRVYSPGFGESFFQGAYLDDLPRAVRQRIAPELARRATEAEAARVAQERQDAQSRQAAQPQQQDKFALVVPKSNFSAVEIAEEARRRVGVSDQSAATDTSRASERLTASRSATSETPVASGPTVSASSQAAQIGAADPPSSGYGWWAILGLIGLGIYLRGAAKKRAEQRRRDELFRKYGDTGIVNRILAGEMWQGMAASMLRDSWGSPVDIGRQVYKTRVTETWKYGQTGKNRFKTRVIIENDIVVGFESK